MHTKAKLPERALNTIGGRNYEADVKIIKEDRREIKAASLNSL